MGTLTDIAIVGGGPIGLATARVAADLGVQTLVFERSSRRSTPSCCSGLVSPRTLLTLGVSRDSVLREIRGVRIHLPSGKHVDLLSDQVKAFAIDRTQLEAELLRNACEAGAIVRFEAEAIGAESGTLMVRSGSENQRINAPVIVGADGPQSSVAKWFSLGQPSSFIAAAQVELEDVSSDSDCVDVFVGDEVAPGFFGWSVPAEGGILRVGLGVLPPHLPAAFLDHLLAKRYPSLRIRSRSAGWIPLTLTPRPAAAGAILVGDAAGHVKPLSGGGLYTGGVCARIAGETAAQVAKSENEAPDLLASYAKRCLEAIGEEQAFGLSIRAHLSRLSDGDIDAAATALDDRQFLKFLADNADIDFFHELPDRLASEPRLWATLLRVIPLLESLTG